MPFFHDQGRSSLRRMYVEAWRKHRESLPVEPVEDQIIRVIELHPEYTRVLESGGDALDRDYTPEDGQTNPFLHMGLHLAIREQVGDEPARRHRRRAPRAGGELGDVHDAEHAMIECLGEALWNAQRAGLPPDETRTSSRCAGWSNAAGAAALPAGGSPSSAVECRIVRREVLLQSCGVAGAIGGYLRVLRASSRAPCIGGRPSQPSVRFSTGSGSRARSSKRSTSSCSRGYTLQPAPQAARRIVHAPGS